MFNSPLMLGNDVRKMSKETLGIITDRDIIALNQDKPGVPGFLSCSGRYRAICQASGWWTVGVPVPEPLGAACRTAFDWNLTSVKDEVFGHEITFDKKNVRKIRDLYAKKELGTTQTPLKAKLEKHQSLVVRVY
jgi:alpha-galactosidase